MKPDRSSRKLTIKRLKHWYLGTPNLVFLDANDIAVPDVRQFLFTVKHFLENSILRFIPVDTEILLIQSEFALLSDDKDVRKPIKTFCESEEVSSTVG